MAKAKKEATEVAEKKPSKMKNDPAWQLTKSLGISLAEARARIAAESEPSPTLVDKSEEKTE